MWTILRFTKLYGCFHMISGVLYIFLGFATLIPACHVLHLFPSALAVCYGSEMYQRGSWSLSNMSKPMLDFTSQIDTQWKINWAIFFGLTVFHAVVNGVCLGCWDFCPSSDSNPNSCSPAVRAAMIFPYHIPIGMILLMMVLFFTTDLVAVQQLTGWDYDCEAHTVFFGSVMCAYTLVRFGCFLNEHMLNVIRLRFLWLGIEAEDVLEKRRWIPIRVVSASL